MRRQSSDSIAVAIAIIALALPILVSVQVARHQSLEAEEAQVLNEAQDILRRSDDTGTQIRSGAQRLLDAKLPPCSPAEMNLMRDIALTSNMIQAIGRVSDGQFICTSLGTKSPIPLGEPDYIGPLQASVRAHVELPIAKQSKFVVVEWKGFAAVVEPGLPIDVQTEGADVSLAVFTSENGEILSHRGAIKPAWLGTLRGQPQTAFYDGDYVVGVAHSKQFGIAALAAAPAAYYRRRVEEFAAIFVPVGLLGGLALAWAAQHLVRARLSMASVLRTALKRNEFFVEYQPVVDLSSREWVGAEALVRWRRSDGKTVRPDLFIPLAEEIGVISRITECVVKAVAADAPDIFARKQDFHIAINFSSQDLQSTRTAEMLQALLRDTGFKPAAILVEATERGFLDNSTVRAIVQKIRSAGMRLAIDDFGTGYSSLSYLEKYEFDYLKIDKSFVDTIGTDGATSQVVLHIIEMAHALGLEMIAEGVENQAQAQFLERRGVRYAQGWLFGKPMSATALKAGISATAERPATRLSDALVARELPA